ncbi:AzlD domain-containing protein [Terasakiella pusilla]|uniref:AzlD domain-containing protein n=1 Tax=Terasakiella pusilla TaxID=64973 RepID=UPI003AA7E737
MGNDIWMVLVICALGTFLMRLVPLLWMQRHLARRKAEEAIEEMPTWLSVLGPLMIAGMFGVSLIPSHPSPTTWIATLLGVVATYVVWRFTQSLGWPVFAGVLVFGAVVLLG